MAVRWTQAVIDIPTASFDHAAEFWRTVSGSEFGDIHPDHDEFVHLVPPTGAMHLELQRIGTGPAAAHLDLLVEDIETETTRAVTLGADVISNPGHVVLTSPGGVRFCIVPWNDESEKAPPLHHPAPHAIDRLCIDIPAPGFEDDIDFWPDLLGWPIRDSSFDEFRLLEIPDAAAMGVILQRTGPDDSPAAHLDISCGDAFAEVAEWHVSLGASIVDERELWIVLDDPAGMPYCVTDRQL